MPAVRHLTPADQEWKLATLERGWGSAAVARLGELVDVTDLPGFVAERRGARVGLTTFADRPDGIEVVTIQALVEGEGVGRALLDRLRSLAIEAGAPRLWLITTNDNLRARSFYMRWGMNMVRVVHEGVAVSRGVKPSIPVRGSSGIEIRHELEFEYRLPS